MARMARRLLALRAISVVIALAGMSLATAEAATTGPLKNADPSVGPNARDEMRHTHDRLHFDAARSPILPRQSIAAVHTSSRMQPAGFNAAGGVQREVLGFAPYWSLSSGGNWNYSLLTTVAYFGLDVNADGSFNTSSSGWSGWNSQQLVTVINSAHQAGDRAVVVIKAFDEATINSIVNNPTATQAAITNTINAIALKNLDGVNVDFEGSASASYPDIQSGFTNFMTQLSAQVHQRWPGATVTVDTYSGSASWDGGMFRIGALAPVVDGLFVMAYDMVFGNLPGQAGPNAPLNGWTYNDTTSVAQYLSKAPASKVILGVPYYGYKWSTTSNVPYAATSGGAAAERYADLQSDFSCALQLSHGWDSTGQSPWASWWSPAVNDPCGGNHNSWRELYYDDATSLRIKYGLVNANNLMGTGMWALGYDGGAPELWAAIRDSFGYPWPGQHHLVTPARVLDTRNGTGGFVGPLAAGQTINLPLLNRGGVPANGVAAIIMNVTETGSIAPGYLTVYPTGTARPPTSNLNFLAGQTVPNLVEVPIGLGGQVSIVNASAGSTHVIADVAGYVATQAAGSGADGAYRPLVPARILDTRVGTGGLSAPLGAGQTLSLQVAGAGGVPATGAEAAMLNVTVTNPTAPSFLSVYPSGGSLPLVSNLNFNAGQTVANHAIVGLGPDGKISIYNRGGQVDVIVDVAGWFTDATGTGAGGLLTGIPPARILDTRNGQGGFSVPVGSGQAIMVPVAGRGGVPLMPAPSAAVLNVTETGATASSYLSLYPSDASLPPTSDLNFTAQTTIANLVVVKLGADGRIAVFNAAGSANVVIDVLGWLN